MPVVRCPTCGHAVQDDGNGCAPWCPDNDSEDVP